MTYEPSNPAPSQMVLHDPIVDNANMANSQVDLGLKPNGLKIDDLRQMGKLSEMHDDLDKIGIARHESQQMAQTLQETSRKAQASYRQIFGKSFKPQKSK